MNIAICDVCARSVQQIVAELNICLSCHHIDPAFIHIAQFSSASELLTHAEDYALVFSEILLPGISGLDMAKQLKDRPNPPVIVFVTSSPDYCLDSYDIGVEGYLLKPIQRDKFERAFERFLLPLCVPSRTLDVYSNRLKIHVPIHTILYVESIGRKCLIHTSSIIYETNLALSSIEETIADSRFVRCYRSYLVNMQFIADFKQDRILLTNGEYIPLTLRKRSHIVQIYQQFLIDAVDSQK